MSFIFQLREINSKQIRKIYSSVNSAKVLISSTPMMTFVVDKQKDDIGIL